MCYLIVFARLTLFTMLPKLIKCLNKVDIYANRLEGKNLPCQSTYHKLCQMTLLQNYGSNQKKKKFNGHAWY